MDGHPRNQMSCWDPQYTPGSSKKKKKKKSSIDILRR
jgi:hypothetical protein